MKDTQFGAQVGTASGLLYYGFVPAGRQQFQGLIGSPMDLSRKAISVCSTYGVQALSVFIPKIPKTLETSLRPLELWSFGGLLVTVEEPMTLRVKETRMWDGGSEGVRTIDPAEERLIKYREAFMGAAAGDADQSRVLSEIVAATSDDKALMEAVQQLQTYSKPSGPGYKIMIVDDSATQMAKFPGAETSSSSCNNIPTDDCNDDRSSGDCNPLLADNQRKTESYKKKESKINLT